MNTKGSIFTSGVATSDNTDFGVHEWNKIRSYTEKNQFSVSFMLLFTIIMLSPTRRLSHQKTNLGDNCIQNVNLGRYIVGYMVRKFV